MAEKIVRDPVHDVIAFRLDRPDERLLFDLMNAGEFQRLRRIRQLGLASLAYPGADHSRYSHSLGVMETARRILDRLGREHRIGVHDRTVCLAAALLHDLGHGPFSHVFERVSGVHHELLTRRVVLDPTSEVHQVLIRHGATMPEEVVDLLECRPGRTFLSDVLTSQLDADRLDYLLRDNLMTGSRYGDYDLRWLIQAMEVDSSSKRLVVNLKAVSAVEAYLQARYHMYRNVYFHKVVRAAEGMVKLALQRAKRLAVQDRLAWPPVTEGVAKALRGERMTAGDFSALDDVSVLSCFKAWSAGDDPPLARLCRGLLGRSLFKTIDLSRLPPADAERAYERARRAVIAAGGDGTYDLFYDEVGDTPYKTDAGVSPIYVCGPDGALAEFPTVSPLAASLNQRLTFRRLHVAAEHRDVAASAVASG